MRLGTWHRVHTYTVQLRLFDAGFIKMYGRRQPSTRMDIQHPNTCTARDLERKQMLLNFLSIISNKKNITTLLPVTNSKKMMSFVKWSFLDTLKVNKFGILEPAKTKKCPIWEMGGFG